MLKFFIVINVIWVLGCTPVTSTRADAPASSSGPVRPVYAHWIVPMKYSENEDPKTGYQNDVRAAMELGVSGFALDMQSFPRANDVFKSFISAADAVGAPDFKFFLSADSITKYTAEGIVQTMKAYGNNPHYLHINGKPLLSTYSGGSLGNQWYSDNILKPLANAGIAVTFIPNFERADPNSDKPSYQAWSNVMRTFPSVDGLFNFVLAGSVPFYSNDPNIGKHWWSLLEADEALAQAVHDSHKVFLGTYVPYYWAVCHSVRQYMEYQGGRGMDNLWTSIITKQHPEMVELVTWNDFSESTFLQPTPIPKTETPGIESMSHVGYYELLKYYVSWYRQGAKPAITKDAVFFFYRTHPNNAVASNDASACKMSMSPDQKWGNIKDVIYVTTALTAPAQLVVKLGGSTQTFNVPAGLSTTDVPFVAGTPTFELVRGGNPITTVAGHQIINNPVVYDFNVFSGYSIAGGANSASARTSWGVGTTSAWFSPSVSPDSPTSVTAH